MKTLVKLFFFLACLGLVAACSEPDEVMADSPEMLKSAILKVKPCSSSNVLTKAETDWQNINEALQNAKPGQTVQLAAGTFYLHKSIVRWGFDATLKGAGVGETIIRTAPDMIFNIDECPPVNWSFENNSGAFMLCFAHDYFEGERTVNVSNLSIIVDEPTPVRPKGNKEINSMHAIMTIYNGLDNDRETPVDLNVSYKNLSVKGEYDEKYLYEKYSVFSGLSAYGYSNGTFEVKNVMIENVSGGIKPHAFMGEDARVIVKNSHLRSCVRGIYSFFCHSWTMQNNKTENCRNGIIMLGRGPSPQLLWEGPDGNSFIVNNKINFIQGVGLGVQNAKNVQIKDNILEGSNLGIASVGGENFEIKDNDLCGVSPVPIFIGSLINSVIKNNSNQIIGGPGAGESSNTIGEGRECDD